MRVKLLKMTEEPVDVMYVAARTCYSEKSPIELWSNDRFPDIKESDEQREKRLWNLVGRVLESGHTSIAEHVSFTFAIEGIDRATSHQLVRHRHCTFSQQSQRYVEIKESYETITEAFDGSTTEQENYLRAVAEKYFARVTTDNYRDYIQALINYLGAVKRGVKPEDARNILPNATKTNLVMTVNLRELMHTSALRLCTRSQLPIRQLFQAIKKEVEKVEPEIASLLVPSCEANGGICREHKSCGKCLSLPDVLSCVSATVKLGLAPEESAKCLLQIWEDEYKREFTYRKENK